ncbi:2370_t:CDS:1, partial [Dentiscutata heterogama]
IVFRWPTAFFAIVLVLSNCCSKITDEMDEDEATMDVDALLELVFTIKLHCVRIVLETVV